MVGYDGHSSCRDSARPSKILEDLCTEKAAESTNNASGVCRIPAAIRAGETRSPTQVECNNTKGISVYFAEQGFVSKLHLMLGIGAPGVIMDYDRSKAGTATVLGMSAGGGDFLARLLSARPAMGGTMLEDASVVGLVRPFFDVSEGKCKSLGGRAKEFHAGDFTREVSAHEVYTMNWCLHDWKDEDVVNVLAKHVSLTNFTIGSSQVTLGLSVWQVMLAIIAAVAVAIGFIGADWPIWFPASANITAKQLVGWLVFDLLFVPFLCASLEQEAIIRVFVVYGQPVWNPTEIALRWLEVDYSASLRASGFFAGAGLMACQLVVNAFENGFSAGMDLAALAPVLINIRRGALIALAVAAAACPWQLLTSASVFLDVVISYTIIVGPILGIQICDYWVLRCRRVQLSALYDPAPHAACYYWHGVNWRAVIAWVVS
ncbi:putative ncs1 nucleoside transporter protein [Neofusicoccum parvum UCRNP2]|uniref:Putative ncs1 nucleoside transporter protein n=1 Tax=Botryosphaeria parva (strain UCR-NP2) TaxID=1287680 RepID=R1GDG3_BOTPV|nr:putative ncs1 nucleoside transporter protein [Neofusicoccum parvum UCRNP2]